MLLNLHFLCMNASSVVPESIACGEQCYKGSVGARSSFARPIHQLNRALLCISSRLYFTQSHSTTMQAACKATFLLTVRATGKRPPHRERRGFFSLKERCLGPGRVEKRLSAGANASPCACSAGRLPKQLISGLVQPLQSSQHPAVCQPTSHSANLPACPVLAAQLESLTEEPSLSARTSDTCLGAQRRQGALVRAGPHSWKGCPSKEPEGEE